MITGSVARSRASERAFRATSSMASLFGTARNEHYAGAKAATTNFTRALAVELGRDRIRVNTLAPDTTPSCPNCDTAFANFQSEIATPMPP